MRHSGLLVWMWVPRTHMIGSFHFWEASRGDGGLHAIWQDGFSLSILRIGYDSGLADFDSTEVHLQDMIHSSGVESSRNYSLGFQEWRLQSGHDGQTFMIRVAQRQHGGSFLRLVWNPGITLFGISTTDRDGRASPYSQEFVLMVHWVGSLEEPFSEGLIKLLQFMISLLICSIQMASCVSTLQDSALSRGCFTSSKLVWDPGIILSFSLVQLIDCRVVMALLEDKLREDCNVPT
jgi:hypothetical protein